LSALAAEALDDEWTLRETRRLLREALGTCLEGRALKSRDVMLAMKRMNSVPSIAVRGEGQDQAGGCS
jgi:hypothetical protein